MTESHEVQLAKTVLPSIYYNSPEYISVDVWTESFMYLQFFKKGSVNGKLVWVETKTYPHEITSDFKCIWDTYGENPKKRSDFLAGISYPHIQLSPS